MFYDFVGGNTKGEPVIPVVELPWNIVYLKWCQMGFMSVVSKAQDKRHP